MIQQAPGAGDYESAKDTEQEDRYLPARMINEVVYCPRLFYLMHVEGQFEHNAETTDGEGVHRRVDARTDALAAPESEQQSASSDQPELGDDPPSEVDVGSSTTAAKEAVTIHARSVTLASDTLGVIAKLDLIEAKGEQATPVDYKRGRPRRAADGTLEAWHPERVQLCLQAIVLRENGFKCDEGVLYFNLTRQRVTVAIDDELIERTRKAVALARKLSDAASAPAPLVDSPKCPKCSLVAICLPDETNRCRARSGQGPQVAQIRLPTTPRDDLRPLYLNTQGLVVGRKSELLQVKEQGKVIQEVRLREINQVNLFGNIQLSTQAMQALLELQIPLVLHSHHGYFYGMLQGTGLKNILLRRPCCATSVRLAANG